MPSGHAGPRLLRNEPFIQTPLNVTVVSYSRLRMAAYFSAMIMIISPHSTYKELSDYPQVSSSHPVVSSAWTLTIDLPYRSASDTYWSATYLQFCGRPLTCVCPSCRLRLSDIEAIQEAAFVPDSPIAKHLCLRSLSIPVHPNPQ